MRKEIFALLLGILVGPSLHFAQEPSEYKAPDGNRVALVVPVSKTRGTWRMESIVEIRMANGALLCTRDFSSSDGQHGEAVAKAAWTADSQFFVFSTSLTGGHQPWHFPTYFYSRRLNEIRSLDALVGPILTPEFKLLSPDLIKTQTWQKPGDLTPRPLAVRLNELQSIKSR